MKRLGRHAILDVSGAAGPLQEAEVTSLFADMAKACDATLLRIEMHKFGDGCGMTAIAILAQSHISLHEWPEYGFVAFDIFVCGSANPEPAVGIIKSRFPGSHVETQIIDREVYETCIWLCRRPSLGCDMGPRSGAARSAVLPDVGISSTHDTTRYCDYLRFSCSAIPSRSL